MSIDPLAEGIQAARNGEREKARTLLTEATRQMPSSARAWYWLSTVIDDPRVQSIYQERAIELDSSIRFRINLGESASTPTPSQRRLTQYASLPTPSQPRPGQSASIPLQSQPRPPQSNASDSSVEAQNASDSSRPQSNPPQYAGTPTPMQQNPGEPASESTPSQQRPVVDSKQPVNHGNEPLPNRSSAPKKRKKNTAKKPWHASTGAWILLFGVAGLGLLCLCIIAVVLIFTASDYGTSLDQAGAFVPPTPTNSPSPTFFQSPTTEPTPTPSPQPTHRPTNTPSITPTIDATQTSLAFGFQITSAKNSIQNGNYTMCLNSYDQLLQQMPDWDIGYLNRAICKRLQAEESHYLGDYQDGIYSAIADMDQAIQLNPFQGNYYIERAHDYSDLGQLLESMTDIRAVNQIALDNVEIGFDLDPTEPNASEMYASLLIDLDRCKEASAIYTRLLGEFPDEEDQIFLNKVLGISYYCQGKYAQAEEFLQISLNSQYDCRAYQYLAMAQYGQGNDDIAYLTIDNCLEKHPNYCGYRYYIRSLINYDRGDLDQAMSDLWMGYGNTWGHGGLYAYLMGMFSLESGDQETAREWLLYAADTVYPWEGPLVRNRIDQELAALNTSYNAPTQSITWDVTPIVIPSTLTPTPYN